MRQALLIIGSIVVIAIGFTIYVFIQTPPPKGGPQFQPIDAPAPTGSENVDSQELHPGKSVFMKSYDSKTHQLANEFRADTYDPKPDGTIDMTNPEARFFLGGGQMLQINGDTGNVIDPNAAGGKMQGESQTPSRGKLQHVILRLFKAVNDKDPQFTCWVNNLSFDNDSTTIDTEDCDIPDAQGNVVHVPFDQVPVHVVGIDYDFDGRGLKIKWNERDRHLQELDIAHGEQLVIKHPNGLNNGAPKDANTAATMPSASIEGEAPHVHAGLRSAIEADASIAPLADADGPIALASADPDAGAVLATPTLTPKPATRPAKKKKRRPTSKPATLPAASQPVIHRAKDPGVYRATFSDNVHITQADQTIATADLMNVDFFMNNGHATTEPSTQATTQFSVGAADAADAAAAEQASSDISAAESNAAESPQPSPAHKRARAEASANRAPSTQPDVPVIVRWTGTLVVAPPDADVPPLTQGDSVLQLIGENAPAVLIRSGSIIHCASFRYHTLDQSADLKNSTAFPIVTVFDANGTKVFAPAVAYDGAGHTATIAGPANAEFPVASSNANGTTQPTPRSTQIAKADWTDSCTLTLRPDQHGGEQVTEALLDGDVHVDHPQIKLRADELDLGLDDPPAQKATATSTTQPSDEMNRRQLRSMDASGSVHCALHDSQGKPQWIDADHLTLGTVRDATGTDVPAVVTADGTVHASDPTQSLNTQHLLADLEPSPPGSRGNGPATARAADRPFGGDVQLRDLTATDDVHFRATDGTFADARRLHIETLKPASGGIPANQDIELTGDPTADVGDKDSTVTGPLIHYNPSAKQAHVIGPGTIHGIQALGTQTTAPQPTSRPVDVAWQTSFAMDGMANTGEIKGDVHTRSVSADGTVNTAVGDRVEITMIDTPSAVSPTSAPAVHLASTAPSTAPSDLAKANESNFMKDKQIDTITLLGRDDQNVEVSSVARDPAGKLLHSMNLFAPKAIYNKTEDTFTVPTPGRMLVRDFRAPPPTSGPANASADSSAGGTHGISAFQWEKSLVYNQRTDEAVMTGDVQVAHESAGAASYQMYADQITAIMDPNSHPTSGPTTGPSTSASHAAPPTGEDTMKVKRLIAQGQVHMVSQRLQFTAAQAVYDPETQIMTAHGSLREPAELLDEQGLSTGSFDELVYNTKTDQVQIKEFQGNMRK